MKAYWGSGGIAQRILDLGIRRRWVVSFTSRPLYPHRKSPWYPLDRKLGGLQSRSGRGGGGEKFPALAGTRTLGHPARSLALYHWAIPAPASCVVGLNTPQTIDNMQNIWGVMNQSLSHIVTDSHTQLCHYTDMGSRPDCCIWGVYVWVWTATVSVSVRLNWQRAGSVDKYLWLRWWSVLFHNNRKFRR
jgi:hypothetical protein